MERITENIREKLYAACLKGHYALVPRGKVSKTNSDVVIFLDQLFYDIDNDVVEGDVEEYFGELVEETRKVGLWGKKVTDKARHVILEAVKQVICEK